MKSKTTIAIPPGVTIKEQLVDRGMSQKEFAFRMDMSQKHISKLINGEVQLTSEAALRLEMVLGLPAHFWSNLEIIYREQLVRVQAENEMEKDLELMKKIPYAEMAKNGWVEDTRKAVSRVYNTRQFFEVSQLSLLQKPLIPNIACRRLGESEKSDYALLVWAQRAKLEARKIQVQSIDLERLKRVVEIIRRMTTKDPYYFVPELSDQLAKCGIALVFLPQLSGSYLHGATFCEGHKIVIGMTVRGKDADRFWFSLFHELGHVLLGHIYCTEGLCEEDEKAADVFAQNALIPACKFEEFVKKQVFDKFAICEFAKQIDIDAGIVVGRLQREKYIPFNRYNELKTHYEFTL